MLDTVSTDEIAPGSSPPRPAPGGRRAARRYGWWAGVAVLLLLLGLLGYAEADWLHQLPQDRASRVTLIVLPDARSAAGVAGSSQALTPDWPARLLEAAADRDLLAAVIERLDLRDPATGETMPADELATHLRLGGECIEQRVDAEPPRRGLLVYAVVRGDRAIDTDAIARAWSEQFIRHSRARFPGLTAQPVASVGVPYELCR
jgi:hypothetical protein